MRHVMLTSSVMRSAGYDDDSWTLEVKFSSNELYRYLRVPCLVFVGLIKAESAGDYFNKYIKGRYECYHACQEVQA
jgi:hypothetical protein